MLLTSRRALRHAIPSVTRLFTTSRTARMKERAIVSSFICRTPGGSLDNLEFALFKRSKNVSTYQQKWAVCSGSIEPTDPTPEYAARREIEEETQLTSSDVTLHRTARPFRLTDNNLQITWLIHTFAFLLNDPNKEIVIEREHTEFKFIHPSDLAKNQHVPVLEEGMRRVLPGKEVEEGLRALRDDHDNGAEVLATTALETLQKAIKGSDFDIKKVKTASDFWFELRLAAWTIGKNGRPDMSAAIESALSSALLKIAEAVEEAGGQPFEPNGLKDLECKKFRTITEHALTTTISERKTRMGAVAQSFLYFIQSSPAYSNGSGKLNILTLSHSSSVTAALKRLINNAITTHPIHLNVLESRPRFDGLAFIRSLFSSSIGSISHSSSPETALKNLTVSILADAAVAQAAKEADLVVIGADKLAPDGAVSNKIGSLPACLLAKSLGKKEVQVVVVATSDKIMSDPPDEDEEHKLYDAREMTAVYPQDLARPFSVQAAGSEGDGLSLQGAEVRVRNTYFEWVAPRYINAFVTEEGVMDVSKLQHFAKEKKETKERLFEGLWGKYVF